jgi:hypothetical protein
MAYQNGYFPLNFGEIEIDLESTNASGFFSVLFILVVI